MKPSQNMNAFIIQTPPRGDFEEISICMPDWQARFVELVKQRAKIQYEVYSMPVIPQGTGDDLGSRGYCDLILDGDTWQHFLIPKAC